MAADDEPDEPYRPGDLATQLANEFQEQWLASVDEDQLKALDEANDMLAEKRRTIFTRVDFRWRPADKEMLEQIRVSTDMVMGTLYEQAQAIMAEFYAEMRIPETREVDGQRIAVLDSQRRQVWKRDERGEIIEDVSQLTGQDIDRAILGMQRVRFVVARLHNQLLNEAILARHLYDDRHADGYASLVEGTQGDRNAKASRDSRRDKYKAFFHWNLYSSSNSFMQEINSFIRILDRMAERGVWGERRRK